MRTHGDRCQWDPTEDLSLLPLVCTNGKRIPHLDGQRTFVIQADENDSSNFVASERESFPKHEADIKKT